MKGLFLTIFALLGALILVFLVLRPSAATDPQMAKWEAVHDRLSVQIHAASIRAKARSSGDELSNQGLASEEDENRLAQTLMQKQVAVLESKPTARTKTEDDELSDLRRTLSPSSLATPVVASQVNRLRQTPPPAAFQADVGYSQRAAVRKHPNLAVAGSPLNKAFLARLAQWKSAHDPRLERSDWPEMLAEECEAR